MFHWRYVLESQIEVERLDIFLSSLVTNNSSNKLWFRALLNLLLHLHTIFGHWHIVKMSLPNFKTAHRVQSSSCLVNFLTFLYCYRILQRCIVFHLIVFDTEKDKVSRFGNYLNWALGVDTCSTTNLSAFKIPFDLYTTFQIVKLTYLLLVMDD